MKSLQELAAIRDRMKQTVSTREAAHDSVRVVVGMATCGIAAGARPVLNAFTEEVARRELHDVLGPSGLWASTWWEAPPSLSTPSAAPPAEKEEIAHVQKSCNGLRRHRLYLFGQRPHRRGL